MYRIRHILNDNNSQKYAHDSHSFEVDGAEHESIGEECDAGYNGSVWKLEPVILCRSDLVSLHVDQQSQGHSSRQYTWYHPQIVVKPDSAHPKYDSLGLEVRVLVLGQPLEHAADVVEWERQQLPLAQPANQLGLVHNHINEHDAKGESKAKQVGSMFICGVLKNAWEHPQFRQLQKLSTSRVLTHIDRVEGTQHRQNANEHISIHEVVVLEHWDDRCHACQFVEGGCNLRRKNEQRIDAG